jgi:hypothetical protein
MFRYALDALRAATAPMTVAVRMVADATSKQRNALEAGLRSCLEQNAGKTVQRVGEGVPRRWTIMRGLHE